LSIIFSSKYLQTLSILGKRAGNPLEEILFIFEIWANTVIVKKKRNNKY